MVFTSPLNPDNSFETKFIQVHGDAVRDIAMRVDDVRKIYKQAIERGAKSVKAPKVYKDKYGSVLMASLQTYGDTIHTLIQHLKYKGPFLPGYEPVDPNDDPLTVKILYIDFCRRK